MALCGLTLDDWVKVSKIFTPLIQLFAVWTVGWWINNEVEKLKSRLQLNNSLIEKRTDIYADVGNDLNTIYTYIKRVGDWKDLTPMAIIVCKREVDKRIHTTQPYWSQDLIKAYANFMGVCFVTNLGHKKNAGIIADIEKYKKLSNWKEDFNQCYQPSDFNEDKLDKAYQQLMDALSEDFGVVSKLNK